MDNSNRDIDQGFDIQPVLKFFKRFYYIILHFLPEDNKRQMHLEKLYSDISQYNEEAVAEYKAYLPFLWLKKQKNIFLKR